MTKERKSLERKLHDVMLDLVRWRDGGCVLRDLDGGRCNGALQGGHVVPVARAGHLRFELENIFCQCASHNLLHYRCDPIYPDWYSLTWGHSAYHALTLRMLSRSKYSEVDLRERLERYLELWDNRPAVYDRSLLVVRGYYGELSFQS